MNTNINTHLPINLVLNRDNRLELTKTDHFINNENAQKVSKVIFKNQSRKERSVKTKAYHSWNILHHLEIRLKKSILVELDGTQVLINVGSIKKRTGLKKNRIFRSTQLIQDITIALATRCLQNQTTHTTRPIKLGKGSFGKAVKITTESGEMVAKYSRKSAGDEGTRDVAKEYENHARFFQGQSSSVYGLQIPYSDRRLLYFPEKHGDGIRGVMANIGHLYNGGSYFEINTQIESDVTEITRSPLPFEDSVAAFHQMLYSLHYMEEHGATHEDIKGENIFIDQIQGGQAIDLADLASLQFNNQPIPTEFSGTRIYSPLTDRAAFLSLTRNLPRRSDHDEKEYFDIQINERSYQAIRALKAKRDVYSTGVTMYASLTGKFPYPSNSLGYNINSSPYEEIPNVPPEFNDLLRRMLDHNHETRIGRTEAWNAFNAILNQYPDFKIRVEANIAAIGRAPPSETISPPQASNS